MYIKMLIQLNYLNDPLHLIQHNFFTVFSKVMFKHRHHIKSIRMDYTKSF